MRFLLALAVLGSACSGKESGGETPNWTVDADGDGHPAEDDCDDADPAVGGAEVPYDGVDNDCDPATPDDDLDGDGFAAVEDCDDGDPLAWRGDEGFAGDLTEDFASFCTSYCERGVGGNLDLSSATPQDVAALTCLSSVDGDLVVQSNDRLRDLSGLYALASVGGDLDVQYSALTSLSGLGALFVVGRDVTVRGDEDLCEEDVDALVAQLTSFSGTVIDRANHGTCPAP
jgi:hypothetical protein